MARRLQWKGASAVRGTGRRRDVLLRVALIGLVACSAAGAEEAAPEPELLEYLGSWEGSDEEWLLFEAAAAEVQANEDEERSDPVPEGEASPESEDES